MQKAIFTEKPHCFQEQLFFSLVKNRFFHLSDIRDSESSFSPGKRFFDKFFIPAIGNGFSVQQKQYWFIQSSVEDFEILEQQTLFLLVETNFWLVELFFFLHFSDTPANGRCFLSSGNVFLNELFISYGENFFFLQFETFTEISGNKFIWERRMFWQKGVFHPMETVFFYFVLLFCNWKPLLNWLKQVVFTFYKWPFQFHVQVSTKLNYSEHCKRRP